MRSGYGFRISKSSSHSEKQFAQNRLVGRSGNNPRPGQINHAQWLVCPKVDVWDAVLVSEDIGDVKQRNPLYIALYKMPPEPERSRVRSMLKKVQKHNAVEERFAEARK